MAEEARRGKGKGTGKEGSEGSHPSKGKGKGQPQGGKGKGQGKGPAPPSAVRRPSLGDCVPALPSWTTPGPRVTRNAWLRNNMRSDSTLRAELSGRVQAAHNAPIAGAKPAAAPKGASVSPLPVSRLAPAQRPPRRVGPAAHRQ